MPDIPMSLVLEQMATRMPLAEAELLVAQALEVLKWPVREQYSAEEMTQIGLAIARVALTRLEPMKDPLAQDLERTVGAVLDTVQAQVAARLKQPRR